MECRKQIGLLLIIFIMAALIVVAQPGLTHTLSSDLNPWAFINSMHHTDASLNGSAARLASASSITNLIPLELAQYFPGSTPFSGKILLFLQIGVFFGGIATLAFAISRRFFISAFIVLATIAIRPWQLDLFFIFHQRMNIYQIPEGCMIALGFALFALSFSIQQKTRSLYISSVLCALFQPLYGFFLAILFIRRRTLAILCASISFLLCLPLLFEYLHLSSDASMEDIQTYLNQFPSIHPWIHHDFFLHLIVTSAVFLAAFKILWVLPETQQSLKQSFFELYGLCIVLIGIQALGLYVEIPAIEQVYFSQLGFLAFLASWILVLTRFLTGLEGNTFTMSMTLIVILAMLFHFPHQPAAVTLLIAILALHHSPATPIKRRFITLGLSILLVISTSENFIQWFKFLKSSYFTSRQDAALWIATHAPETAKVLTPDSGWQSMLKQPVIPLSTAPNAQFIHSNLPILTEQRLLNFFHLKKEEDTNHVEILDQVLAQVVAHVDATTAERLLISENADYFIAPIPINKTSSNFVYQNQLFVIYQKK